MKEFQPIKSIEDLKVGDIIRGEDSRIAYVVTGNYGDRVTAVRTADVTNVLEWEVVREVQPNQQPKQPSQPKQPRLRQ